MGPGELSPHFSRICVARRSERFCGKVGVVDDEVLGEYTLLEEETSQTLSQCRATSHSRKSVRNAGSRLWSSRSLSVGLVATFLWLDVFKFGGAEVFFDHFGLARSRLGDSSANCPKLSNSGKINATQALLEMYDAS